MDQLYESSQRLAVVYGGRFQPFHLGHYRAYKWLCKKFGANNVWIATSNKVNLDSKKDKASPLSFKEKRELIMSLYKVPEDRIVNCKNPAFSPAEVLARYKLHDVVYVAAVGEKDRSRYGDAYTELPESFENKKLTEGPYFVEVPKQMTGLSGTDVRDAIIRANDDDLERIFKKYFGEHDSMQARLLKMRFRSIK